MFASNNFKFYKINHQNLLAHGLSGVGFEDPKFESENSKISELKFDSDSGF